MLGTENAHLTIAHHRGELMNLASFTFRWSLTSFWINKSVPYLQVRFTTTWLTEEMHN